MVNAKKKETRIMKVTMAAEEFEKYDKGITHSDRGIRNEQGRLSALPDISPVFDEDIPCREIISKETVYVEKKQPNTSIGEVIGRAVGEVIADILNDPEIQAGLAELGKTFWYHKVVPCIKDAVQWLKNDKPLQTKAAQLLDKQDVKSEIIYEIEVVDDMRGKITVSDEKAEQLIGMVREEARRLSAMIYLLSNIIVKDDKTQDEYTIEQEYIKQLVSEESRATMEMLITNQNLLDEETAICFSDFLSGYVRHANKLIVIPIQVANNVSK